MDYEKRGDAMIFIYFFLFFPLFQVLAEFAKLTHERGLPIVVFTDNEHSPLSCYASLALKIPRENILFTTSISALTVLLIAIATEIALKKRISSVHL